MAGKGMQAIVAAERAGIASRSTIMSTTRQCARARSGRELVSTLSVSTRRWSQMSTASSPWPSCCRGVLDLEALGKRAAMADTKLAERTTG